MSSLLQQKETLERLREERNRLESQVESLLGRRDTYNELLLRKEFLERILAEKKSESEVITLKAEAEKSAETASYDKLMQLKAAEVNLMSQKAHNEQLQLRENETLSKL